MGYFLEFQVEIIDQKSSLTSNRKIRALCRLCCVCDRGESLLAAGAFRDRLQSLIFQSTSFQCASHWHSRRAEETGSFLQHSDFFHMITVRFPKLFKVRNERSFVDESGGGCSTENLLLMLLILRISEEMNSDGLSPKNRLHKRSSCMKPLPLLFFTSDGSEL